MWLQRVPLRLYYLVYDHTQMSIQVPEPVPFHAQVKPLHVQQTEGAETSEKPMENQSYAAEKDIPMDVDKETVYKCKKKKKKKKKNGGSPKGKDGSPIKIKLKATKKFLKKKRLIKHKAELNGVDGESIGADKVKKSKQLSFILNSLK